MTECVVVAGGNIGDVKQSIEKASRLIEQRIGQIVGVSAWLESEAWGFVSDPFTNRALLVRTEMTAHNVLKELLQIEETLGRNREKEAIYKRETLQKYAARIIDLDIILFGDECIQSKTLEIPHPRATERDFVLKTVAEVLKLSEKEVVKKIQGIRNGKEII
ncbi:MAG: 2-amino-4-hydroxy-6-hydroxymethyldihydropteridine diphosphokinase [Alistipes sp.]|nr:2-amino-4-hydroxy-6-hydroxymethyldihydropteridine diphosphokinase [Candidatus Alistipes equi]